MSSGVSLTSWGEGVSIALDEHHSSDGVHPPSDDKNTLIIYYIDHLAPHLYPLGWLKLNLTLLLDQLRLT